MAKRGIQGAMMRTMQVRDHTATVVSKVPITPSFVRVHLRSDTFFEEAEAAPTAWLRGWFPDPDGTGAEHQRGYTFSSADPETGAFSLDFVLHEPAGPASAWAQRCEPGDALQVNTLGSTKFELPDEPPAGYLLVGDAAAIPGLAGIIAALPAAIPVELYLEEHHPDDRLIPIPEHSRMRTHWVPRTGPQSLEPGTVTALVGPSESGKSTLAGLLAPFYDVSGGAIRIDGVDVRDPTADELYARVGFLFQETQLVRGSVRENIALAEPDASDERVEAAARAASIHDRIARMPEGYDTVLGPDAAAARRRGDERSRHRERGGGR